MEVDAFERVYEAFGDFHAFFAPAFGRKQWREHSGHYLQALLVQSQERRNAENLAEMVPVSARALQRFLTEARAPSPAQATAPGASERRGAQPGAAQGGVARGHGGGGSAGAADIPVQR